MHFSAKRGIENLRSHVVCLSVCLSDRPSICDVGGSGPHRYEILETDCTDKLLNTFALRIHRLPIFFGYPLLSEEREKLDFRFSQYVHRVHLSKSPLEILAKKKHGRLQGGGE